MKPDTRLEAVLSEINCSTLADVGCDHGKVAVGAVLSGRAARVIATDISSKSLLKTQALAAKYKVSDKVECIAGDGLEPVGGRADQTVIAGLGGISIVGILERSGIPERAVLVPHTDSFALRAYLYQKGARVSKDYYVACGKKFYPIIVVDNAGEKYSEGEFFFGKNLPRTEAFRQMLIARRITLTEKGKRALPDSQIVAEYAQLRELCLKLEI